MKSLFFVVFLFIQTQIFCQFNLANEWFTPNNFFNSAVTATKQVENISIERSLKKDDETFTRKEKIGSYYFNLYGALVRSENYVQLKRRIDTTAFDFKYLQNGKIDSRTENQGPFSFRYEFNYIGDSLVREIKIDLKTLDTSYVITSITRFTAQNIEKTTTYNTLNRPMKNVQIQRDLFGQIIKYRESYARSLSYLEFSYAYTATQLNNKSRKNTIGRQTNTDWDYSFVDGFLDEISEKQNGILIKRYGILYNENQLISAVVLRDLKNKSVVIYRVSYSYYN